MTGVARVAGRGSRTIAVLGSDGPWLRRWQDCRVDLGVAAAVELAFGDLDGDGELAVRTDSGSVTALDVEWRNKPRTRAARGTIT